MTQVLVVDDEPQLRWALKAGLERAGYEVDLAGTGEEGLDAAAARTPDLMVLDVAMPGIDGFEVCRQLRRWSRIPVIMLTVRDSGADKIRALNLGADDYLTKPFNKDELIARITAIVRRSKGHAESVIRTGDIIVNLDAKTVEVHNQRVHLTGKEYQMFELLSLRKGTTLTKEMFLNHLYGGMDEPELKIIDVFICKLRKKLANASEGRNFIETVWGRGYVLREPHEEEERIPA